MASVVASKNCSICRRRDSSWRSERVARSDTGRSLAMRGDVVPTSGINLRNSIWLRREVRDERLCLRIDDGVGQREGSVLVGLLFFECELKALRGWREQRYAVAEQNGDDG